MPLRRLGLFGGTFDPPHNGHVAALCAAAATGRFDLIEVTVAGDPYRKSALGGVHSASLRLEMARAAFEHLALVRVSDREINRPGPSYTIDTVLELLEESDDVDVLVGADLVAQLPSWHRADELRELVTVGVIPRPGATFVAPEGWDCYEIAMEPVDLSSTFLREASLDREALKLLMPDDVIAIYQGAKE
ncbi:MAG: nicotinate-nicotinamide nucleotide adenylyltransferase [Acidobacteriota bacterium]|nr:nicotinate-nicotinamide nucleotide adenylyltransferase [Acidobacteriota bacterium]MDE3031528.1 nicotinate-nicotinamide nucleotide adenylyltransferase [Acidobacteriota bacterium]MDE3092922.1 nicotinate-nicotinamide nucleotide adenylyltransferase [Acidobacteriota bacterium]MDE3138797.1 nicotinate-nicotinamide nucleotide adenylyltransferase [Acidobacteriota bacterium]MDE3146503.1 nicotinate-nicotinamide nucleotide adenylyltransferase [Acidobacteriota bacterium]